MPMVWIEFPPDEEGGVPGLTKIDAPEGMADQVLATAGVQGTYKEINRDRALEIMVLSYEAEGLKAEDAKAAALEDMEDWET
jgi:hypothetical protein